MAYSAKILALGLQRSLIPATLIVATPALAQSAAQTAQTTAASPANDTDEIVVTARKTSEDILKTPIAVSALTSDDITQRGVVTLNDLSSSVPGLNVNNNAAGRNDRSFQQVIIRGFTPSQATNPTAALFIDGTPVSSTSAFSTLSDPERVEVLKGPQSAYFGRNTFAGAINFVNKLPSSILSGSVGGTIGTRSNYKLHADLSGPLVDGLLSFRLNADRFATGRGGGLDEVGGVIRPGHVVDHDARALPCEHLDDGLTDSAVAARDDGGPVFQLHLVASVQSVVRRSPGTRCSRWNPSTRPLRGRRRNPVHSGSMSDKRSESAGRRGMDGDAAAP